MEGKGTAFPCISPTCPSFRVLLRNPFGCLAFFSVFAVFLFCLVGSFLTVRLCWLCKCNEALAAISREGGWGDIVEKFQKKEEGIERSHPDDCCSKCRWHWLSCENPLQQAHHHHLISDQPPCQQWWLRQCGWFPSRGFSQNPVLIWLWLAQAVIHAVAQPRSTMDHVCLAHHR